MKFVHNTNRIEAFSDAVFAFAATLLVVSLSDESSASVLKIDLVSFFGFFASFFVLILLWKVHYNFFRRTAYIDNWVIGINAVLLFLVLYFIFPLKSLLNSIFKRQRITEDSLATLFELYSLGFFLIFACVSLLYLIAYKKDKSNENKIDLLYYSRHFSIFSMVAVISILMSVSKIALNYGAPGFIYALLGPLCYFHGTHFNKTIRNNTTHS